jgi:hypothetical protein
MNTIAHRILAAVLASAPLPASAWWGWVENLFGDTSLNVGIDLGAHSQTRGRYYDYYAPNWTYPGGAIHPVSVKADQQQTPPEPPEALQQAVQAQRKIAERLATDTRMASHRPTEILFATPSQPHARLP